MYTDRDRTLALAGVFQAARLVQQLAHEGQADEHALSASLGSVLKIDAATTEDVYDGVDGVSLGLALIRKKLSGQAEPGDAELVRYINGIVTLEGRLRNRKAVMEELRRGIQSAEAQMKFFGAAPGGNGVHPRLAAKLGELYSQLISPLGPRIMVTGEQGYLANPVIADRVRSALLAGIRSAFLWHQMKGRRWQLLFNRVRILEQAEALARELR